jgi:hypothetical protein
MFNKLKLRILNFHPQFENYIKELNYQHNKAYFRRTTRNPERNNDVSDNHSDSIQNAYMVRNSKIYDSP